MANINPMNPIDYYNQMQQQINQAEQQFFDDNDDSLVSTTTTSPLVFLIIVIIVFALFAGFSVILFKLSVSLREKKYKILSDTIGPKAATGVMFARDILR